MNQTETLSDTILRLKPSASIEAKAVVDRLRAEGRAIIDFTMGEPDLDSPEVVKAAGIEAIKQNHTHYTPANGIPPLREAVRNKLSSENSLDYKSDQILIGAGAKQLIYSALASIVNFGDEVIVPSPYWVSYPDIVEMLGGTPKIIECTEKNKFKLTPQDLEDAISEKTKCILLNSPNNPSGAVYSKEDLEGLIKVISKYPNLLVISDEIYEHFIYNSDEHVSIAALDEDIKNRTLIVNGVSKAYAMTGWRIGYAAGPLFLIQAMTKFISQTTSCASSISQIASIAALREDQSCIDSFIQTYRARGTYMAELLNGIDGIVCPEPAGAFYLFPSVAGLLGKTTPQGKKLQNDLDVALYFLESVGVAVLHGAAYGLSPYLRFSFAVSEQIIEKGCNLIQKACSELV